VRAAGAGAMGKAAAAGLEVAAGARVGHPGTATPPSKASKGSLSAVTAPASRLPSPCDGRACWWPPGPRHKMGRRAYGARRVAVPQVAPAYGYITLLVQQYVVQADPQGDDDHGGGAQMDYQKRDVG